MQCVLKHNAYLTTHSDYLIYRYHHCRWRVSCHRRRHPLPHFFVIKRFRITSESFIVFLLSVLSFLLLFLHVSGPDFANQESQKLQHSQPPNLTNIWTVAFCRAPDIFEANLDHHSRSKAKSGFSDLPQYL